MATGTNGIAVYGDISGQLASGATAMDSTKCVTRDESLGYLIIIPSSYANNQCVKYSDIKNTVGGISINTTDNTSGNIYYDQVVYSSNSLSLTSVSAWMTYANNNSANCIITNPSSGRFQIFKNEGTWAAGYYYFVVWGTTYGNHLYEIYLSSTQANTLNTQKLMAVFSNERKSVLSAS